tara:strand:+ start:3814 stop:4764 length:951 start_codon:yes stop_codon:yes gene_type:complete
MTKVLTLKVPEEERESRLDKWLCRRFPTLSHGLVQKLLRTGQVRVDGARAKGGLRLEAGQLVRVPPLTTQYANPEGVHDGELGRKARDLRSRILFEDEAMIALDKPSGLAVQGGTKQDYHIDNLSHGLVRGKNPRPRLVHRLDKDTSGVLLLAKSLIAARELTSAFRTDRVEKTYWAIVDGVPQDMNGQIENLLGKTQIGGAERIVVGSKNGRRARTKYEVLDRSTGNAALLALYPLTGRMHQLRVHCVDLGTPIIGDRKYNASTRYAEMAWANQLQLHARKLVLHRDNGREVHIEAPLPSHMKMCLKGLGFSGRN